MVFTDDIFIAHVYHNLAVIEEVIEEKPPLLTFTVGLYLISNFNVSQIY